MLPRLLARNWPELIHMLTSSHAHFLTRLFLTYKSALQSLDILRTRGVAPSDFRPLRRFLAAASRRSLGRVSVPMWPVTLSGRLMIVALVGHYPTN